MLIDTDKLRTAIQKADAEEAERIDRIKDDRRALSCFSAAERKYLALYEAIEAIESMQIEYLPEV